MKMLYKAKRIDNGEWVEGFYSPIRLPIVGEMGHLRADSEEHRRQDNRGTDHLHGVYSCCAYRQGYSSTITHDMFFR